MPSLLATQHIKLPRDKDRRVKLTDKERADIQARYKAGEGVRSIARVYSHVSRRLIQFVLFPERAKVNAQHYKNRAQAQTTYAKVKGEKWASIMRKHRHYKQDTLRPEMARKHLRKD